MHLLLAKVWIRCRLEGKIKLGPRMTVLIAYASLLSCEKDGNNVNEGLKMSRKPKNIRYFVVVELDIELQQLHSHPESGLTKQFLLLVFLSFSRYLETEEARSFR
jgi:hypothetical protein